MPTWSCLGIPEHHAYLHPYLVDEYHRCLGLAYSGSKLSQGLGHQSCLEPHVRVSHLALYLRLWHQGSHRVDNYHVYGSGPYQHLRNLQGLLTRIRLGYKEVIGPDPQFPGIIHIKGMFRIDKGRDTPGLLGLRHYLEGQCGLSRRLRAEYLYDPASRDPTDPQGHIQGQRTGRYGRDVGYNLIS